MIFERAIPSPPLSRFVEYFYFYEGFVTDHRLDRFLPDGNTEMIIELTGRPQYIHDNDSLQQIQSCRNAWISGIRTKPITIPSGENTSMLIIGFRKGMSFPFFHQPLNELTDTVLDADLIFGSRLQELRERLMEAASPKAMFAVVAKFLLHEGRQQLMPNVPVNCVAYAVEQIQRTPEQRQLRALAQEIGYSQKHFIQLFRRQVGISPKAFLQILRFQKAIQEIEQPGQTNWNSVAQDCGFYDQAHFIHDFKRFSGYTPGEYLLRKRDTLNYVPVGR